MVLIAGARYARHRAKPNDQNLVFRSIRAVFWLRVDPADPLFNRVVAAKQVAIVPGR